MRRIPSQSLLVRWHWIPVAAIVLLSVWGCSSSSGPTGNPTGPGGSSTVSSIGLTADSLANDTLQITVGDTTRVVAQPVDAQGNPVTGVTLVWSSSDSSVATVSSSGLVTSVDLGDADITVSAASGSSTGTIGAVGGTDANRIASVRIRGTGSATSFHERGRPKLVIKPAADTINVGDAVAYAILATTASGQTRWLNPATSWSSSTPSVATIDANGRAVGVAIGSTTITGTVQIVRKGKTRSYSRTALLTVQECGGFGNATSWDFNITVNYGASAAVGPVSWKIHQSSQATGSLVNDTRSSGPAPFNDVYVWYQRVAGSGSISNTEITTGGGATYTTTESGNGPLGALATAELGVHPDLLQPLVGAKTCSFELIYKDPMQYTETSPEGAQNSENTYLGVTIIRAEIAQGARYSPGIVFDSTAVIPAAVTDPYNGEPGSSDVSDYLPATTMSGSIPGLTKSGQAPATYASVHYTLTAH